MKFSRTPWPGLAALALLGGVLAPVALAPSVNATTFTFTNLTTANGLGNNNVNGVFAVGSTVYAATDGGLSISTDGGATFTNRTTANGLGLDTVSGVYAVGFTVYAANYGGLSISTDGGVLFTNRTTADGLGINTVRGVYAVNDTVYAATRIGLGISTDGGATFTNRTTADGLGSNDLRGVYAVDDTVYAATLNGLGISTDGGATFTNRTTANGLGNNTVNGVYVTNDTIYAATTGGLSISTNGGATFTNRTTADGLGINALRGVYAVGSTIYAATVIGLGISTDGGATFTNYTTANGLGSNFVLGVYAVGSTVYAATNGGLSIGSASAPSFTVTFDANGGAGSMSPQSSSTAAALTSNAFTRSGYTFTDWNTDPGGTGTAYANDDTFPFTADDTLYAQWTPNAAPPDPVVFPPSAPLTVTAQAGDASAAITWSPPAAAGSFPITTYQAVASPGGRSCLATAPALTCTISGLANNTTYTATVRALNGAGWGPYSAASAEFNPRAPVTRSITITGTRGDVRGKPGVIVTGTTTGVETGTLLRPWIRFPGQTSYSEGSASIRVTEDGTVTWQRRTGKKIYVYLANADGSVKSNRIIIDR